MDKAYSGSDLVDRLKGQGLDLVEEAAGIILEEVFNWLEDSAKISENQYDDLIMAVLPMIKGQAFKYIDKIDGEVG